MTAISSWGRLSRAEHEIRPLVDRHQAIARIQGTENGIAHALGRSYGDICLNPDGGLWFTRGLDRFIHFDDQTGLLACEAGLSLREIQRVLVPRGWILPVTPGTQIVTIGGAIANDVHGKNHHVLGSFGDHVTGLRLARTDGRVIDCGPGNQADWFTATVGGMGLTGIILDATIQLRRIKGPWLDTETIPYTSLDAFFQLADESEADWEHTVSWIDCLSGSVGRGLFMRGNPSPVRDPSPPRGRSLGMPLSPPISLVNGLTLPFFNKMYYHMKGARAGRARSHYEPFFYPLDNLLNWNRMYGPRGFYQYQSVFPRAPGRDAVAAMLGEIARSGEGSFLAVLKTFGNRRSVGMMSFPMPGVTLALDFPNRGTRTETLFRRLDSIVQEAGGRLYPAKDARMPRDLFEAGYPNLDLFSRYRDPGLSSALSRRLMGT
jgi:FAD/FMN-containing dehydrogenase